MIILMPIQQKNKYVFLKLIFLFLQVVLLKNRIYKNYILIHIFLRIYIILEIELLEIDNTNQKALNQIKTLLKVILYFYIIIFFLHLELHIWKISQHILLL